MKKTYEILWKIGECSGCHQLPKRSFFFKGKQFPICARCTGALLGYIFGIVLYAFIELPIWVLFSFCAIMFVDWFVQFLGMQESNNVRRLVTGILCGIGLIQIYIKTISCFLYYGECLMGRS